MTTKYKRMRISPDLAIKILETTNVHNRPLTQSHVTQIANDMKDGRWRETNASIGFCVDGSLADGQHRLWAVVESGCTVEFNVAENLPMDAFNAIDIGKVRTLADLAGIDGIPNSTLWAGAVRWIMWYEVARPKGHAWGTFKPSKIELKEYGDGKSALIPAVAQSANYPRFGNLATPSIAAFVTYYANQYDADKATRFLEGMHSGAGLTETSPIYVLREKLVSFKTADKYKREVTNVEVAAWCVKAFNAFVRNLRVKQYRWQEDEPFPEFVK